MEKRSCLFEKWQILHMLVNSFPWKQPLNLAMLKMHPTLKCSSWRSKDMYNKQIEYNSNISNGHHTSSICADIMMWKYFSCNSKTNYPKFNPNFLSTSKKWSFEDRVFKENGQKYILIVTRSYLFYYELKMVSIATELTKNIGMLVSSIKRYNRRKLIWDHSKFHI